MSLSQLFDGDFEAYFAECDTGSPLWLFVHVPKTAGSSLATEISQFLRPSRNIHIDRSDEGRPYSERYEAAVAGFILEAKQTRVRFASGHLIESQSARIRNALPDVRMITMLRHPVPRVVSDYRYQRTPMHPTHEEFKKKMPTLAHYVEQLGESNKMARYLVPNALLAAGDAQTCIDYMIRNYAFIGLQEMYPLCFQTLTTLLGNLTTPSVKKRVNEVTAENPLGLTPELEHRIRSLNALDLTVYEAFSQSYKAIRQELIDFLRARRQARGRA